VPIRERKFPLQLRSKTPRFPTQTERLSSSQRLRQRVRMALAVAALGVAFVAIYPMYERMIEGGNAHDAVTVTPCDRLAAHPDDLEKRAPGISTSDMDMIAARKACHRVVEKRPDDARAVLQLSRTYIEGGDPHTGLRYLRRAVTLGYAQAQFALAVMTADGTQIEQDICGSGRLFMAAARQRHLLAKVRLVNGWMDGLYKDCALDVSDAELTLMVSGARELTTTADEEALVRSLAERWAKKH